MKNSSTYDKNSEKLAVTYIKPAITAYDVTTIRQALGPAVGFSTGRSNDDELLFGDDS